MVAGSTHTPRRAGARPARLTRVAIPVESAVRLRPFGNYLLVRRISAGGMADVFRARAVGARGFTKSVAIKRIFPHLAESDRFVRMFADEARIASRLVHPNIVQIRELGEHRGVPFIAMEYVPGRDLYLVFQRLVEAGERVPAPFAVRVVADVARALEHAHAFRHHDQPQDIVHRDVSPRNVLVGWGGEVKLADFGVARARDREEHTEHGLIKGKVRYLSPEAAAGRVLDRRSDLFSLGVVLAELLIMRPLRDGANDLEILATIRRGELDRQRLSAVPAPLLPVVERALATRPEERYQHARELRDDLLARARDDLAPWDMEATAGLMSHLFAKEIAREEREEQEVERQLAAQPQQAALPATQSPPRPPAGIFPSIQRVTTAGRLSAATASPGQEPERPDEEGDLTATSLTALLYRLAASEAAGRLDFRRPPLRKTIHLEYGDPVFVTSNLEHELFGEHLVGRGVLPRTEHARALDFAAARGLRFTEALLTLELLPSHQLFRHLAEQSQERILELFTWTAGRFAFFRNVEPPSTGTPLGLRTYPLVHEGVRSFTPLPVIRRRLDPIRHQTLRRCGGLVPDALQLSGREQRALRSLEAEPHVTLDELIRREHEEDQTLRLVYLLLEMELLEE